MQNMTLKDAVLEQELLDLMCGVWITDQSLSDRRYGMQSAKELVQRAMDENPEMSLILEIAARAREMEARELPREIHVSTEVSAIPINSQCAV